MQITALGYLSYLPRLGFAVSDPGRSAKNMKIRSLLYSFLVAWVTSISLLMIVGVISETRRFSGVSDAVPALVVFGSASFMVLALVWIILVIPCFYAARRYGIRPHRLLGSLAASFSGFGLMYALMNFLPVEHKQWLTFCLIAAVVACLSSIVLFAPSSPEPAVHSH